MNHLIISREYPPSTYSAGGIATYVRHVARLLAERGDTVHVIGELWDKAPEPCQTFLDGRLIVHRVPLGQPQRNAVATSDSRHTRGILRAMARSEFPAQSFSWQAGLLAEWLVQHASIDVIEAQEFEAPLYYFLLRRALGLGPVRQPPCFVHLHSPTEFVYHYNGWTDGGRYLETIKRLEDYVIASADRLLCPSHYLARQSALYYGIDEQSIERIPYPIGAAPFVERSPETWANGTICYVGRMEARKGVLEWIDAAVAAAHKRPGLRFEFIGSDTPISGTGGPTVQTMLQSRIPERVQRCFNFVGPVERAALWTRLSHARLVVVPSRWDNFPHVCAEAMCSGLPVLASSGGGMVEMIEDGRTGWVASGIETADLSEALDRALATPPASWMAMGRAASVAIREICDNTTTLDRQLEFRAALVKEGPRRSLRVPTPPPARKLCSALHPRPPLEFGHRVSKPWPAEAPRTSARGIALVVVHGPGSHPVETAASLEHQVTPPASVVVVERSGLLRGIRLAAETPSLGIAIVVEGCRLSPDFLEKCESVLASDHRIGLVSSWYATGNDDTRVTVRPCPRLPYQTHQDDVSSCCVMRTSAVLRTRSLRERAGGELTVSDLVLSLLGDGWLAVNYPAVLSIEPRHKSVGRAQPEPLNRGPFTPGAILRLTMREQLQLVARALRNPRYATRWLSWHGWSAVVGMYERAVRTTQGAWS